MHLSIKLGERSPTLFMPEYSFSDLNGVLLFDIFNYVYLFCFGFYTIQ